MKTSFYVELHTGADYSPDEYTRAAGQMANLLAEVFVKEHFQGGLTKGEVAEVQVECEVSMETDDQGMELVGKAVLDIEGPKPVKLDKPSLSSYVKKAASNSWGSVKVLKKQVMD